jgi:P4 family phage/plasmid primase-like protien
MEGSQMPSSEHTISTNVTNNQQGAGEVPPNFNTPVKILPDNMAAAGRSGVSGASGSTTRASATKRFCDYISQFRVEKGCEFTHTSLGYPKGAFYISGDELENFMVNYENAFLNKEDLYLTEKHRELSPVLIDLDFRFQPTDDVPKREYTREQIQKVVEAYASVLHNYIVTDETTTMTAYVMEKSGPALTESGSLKIVKDGVHIMFPDVITKPSVQLIVRKKVIPMVKDILKDLPLKNKIEDVVDEAVIYKNNWFMYGSKKEGGEPYLATYKIVCTGTGKTMTMTEQPIDVLPVDMVRLFSIRNKYIATPLLVECRDEIAQFEKESILKKINKTRGSRKNNTVHVCENLEYVKNVVECLGKERAEDRNEWMRVGWCLRNIDDRLLEDWDKFSQLSEKYKAGECERHWNYMREGGLGIGSLVMWARKDNPEKFQEIQDRDLDALIRSSRSGTHHDIAKVVHFLYRYDYACASYKQNVWYEFVDHKWKECDSGHSLRSKLSKDVSTIYYRYAAKYNALAANTDEEDAVDRAATTAKELNAIALKLKTTAFKDNIIKECKELFYVPKFEEKLDDYCHLIGFKNGVYDLDELEFREGRPDDFISFSTNINYVPYDETHPHQLEMMESIRKILMDEDIRKYVLLMLASCLNGNVREEKFHIWTGVGANGKSKIIELFESAFGDYCVKLPVTLLTQKRGSSSAASPELARTKGKRFAVLQEPDDDEKLYVGQMKEYTGGDKIMTRALFKDPIEFKPRFKMILVCNHLPHINADDDGTWRRLRVVEYTSKFTLTPDPAKKNEHMMDMDLSSKFECWKEHFMALLIEYYKMYMQEGIMEPKAVLHCTEEYKKENNVFAEFVESELEKEDRGFVSVTELYNKFQYWVKENATHFKATKKAFNTSLTKIMGKTSKYMKVEGWKGYSFKSAFGEAEEEEL